MNFIPDDTVVVEVLVRGFCAGQDVQNHWWMAYDNSGGPAAGAFTLDAAGIAAAVQAFYTPILPYLNPVYFVSEVWITGWWIPNPGVDNTPEAYARHIANGVVVGAGADPVLPLNVAATMRKRAGALLNIKGSMRLPPMVETATEDAVGNTTGARLDPAADTAFTNFAQAFLLGTTDIGSGLTLRPCMPNFGAIPAPPAVPVDLQGYVNFVESVAINRGVGSQNTRKARIPS